jgi:hypothetical protein
MALNFTHGFAKKKKPIVIYGPPGKEPHIFLKEVCIKVFP